MRPQHQAPAAAMAADPPLTAKGVEREPSTHPPWRAAAGVRP